MENNTAVISNEIIIEFGKLLKDLLNDIQNSFNEIFENIIIQNNDYKIIYKNNITILENQEYGTKKIELYNSIKNIHAFSMKNFLKNFLIFYIKMKNFL